MRASHQGRGGEREKIEWAERMMASHISPSDLPTQDGPQRFFLAVGGGDLVMAEACTVRI